MLQFHMCSINLSGGLLILLFGFWGLLILPIGFWGMFWALKSLCTGGTDSLSRVSLIATFSWVAWRNLGEPEVGEPARSSIGDVLWSAGSGVTIVGLLWLGNWSHDVATQGCCHLSAPHERVEPIYQPL